MLTSLFFALPVGLIWVMLSDQWSLDGFLVGYVLGVAVLSLIGIKRVRLQWSKLPLQLGALIVYALRLAVDIILSGLDVARRVIDPRMPLNPGIVAVRTQDDSESLAALSAHAITITPGELVVEFDGNETLFVHCLDVEQSAPKLDADQTRRLGMLRRVLGHD